MDYLNDLDLNTTNRRSHRVRSWYLYEQYKSLERNQIDAAKKLKDKSHQDHILRQELFERKARRKLYDRVESCHSAPSNEHSMKSSDTKTALTLSTDDIFESFCELHDDENISLVTGNDSSDESFSQDDSVLLKSYTEDFKSIEDPKDDNSYTESVKSVIENIKSTEKLETVDIMSGKIGKDLNTQLKEAKENIEYIEKFVELSDSEKISENESGRSVVEYKTKQTGTENRKPKNTDNSIFAMWSRLVSFAYQIIRINHGNCYYDYSSQLLTAVLACDVLRRGINRMCNILQPYVSPIKFATDEESDSSGQHHKNVKRKFNRTKKYKKTLISNKNPSRNMEIKRKHRYAQRYCSEDCWRQYSKDTLEKCLNKRKSKWYSEPWRSIPKFTIEEGNVSPRSSSSDSIWPEFTKEGMCRRNDLCDCSCCRRFRNPMLKIAHYIDSILKDLGDCY